ncbi:MAG: 1-(5-phosphoribosyl)-5-[(5-phosphoribosylamino)methylideneamino]imidazole-4-carboxamide isomerase [Solobacterium sp.]|nr:1-(5-phosphoribosyl)-5-[(5-phosphoribosylamino)methylideneamino]imidazole-4-carboxamide isomerase [Solobacterium sp.]
MLLIPAIDLFEKKGVRLYKGRYDEMTVYTEDPFSFAKEIEAAGASWLHVVDLEGAKSGRTPNLDVIQAITAGTSLNVECGGGIRSYETIEVLLASGVKRVILGTKALEDEMFLCEAVERWGDAIAVGVDALNGKAATHGWTNVSDTDAQEFITHLAEIGVSTVIATDISRDGAMKGTNRELYRKLKEIKGINIIASGGVSSLEDIRALRETGVYGAILGRAMYTGAVKLEEALREAEGTR